MRIGILIPHIFARKQLLDKVIFAPIELAINLADTLENKGHEVFLFTPNQLENKKRNVFVDDLLVRKELARQNCTLPQLIDKSPMSYVSISRQLQAEITAKAFEFANSGKIDILHVFMCESEIPLYFSNLLKIPVVYTHHDPYNFYRKYRVSFPKLKNLNYISISESQRNGAPPDLKFVGTVYNGLDINDFKFNNDPADYFAFLGRIIRVKGAHHAIKASFETKSKLKIAGKHYSSTDDDESYWNSYIRPYLDNDLIEYVGFIGDKKQKSKFLSKAKALLFPIEWIEPFGLVMIEALACGTPVIAFDRGPVREIIKNKKTGFIVEDVAEMMTAMKNIDSIDRSVCRKSVEKRFTKEHMANGYLEMYRKVLD